VSYYKKNLLNTKCQQNTPDFLLFLVAYEPTLGGSLRILWVGIFQTFLSFGMRHYIISGIKISVFDMKKTPLPLQNSGKFAY